MRPSRTLVHRFGVLLLAVLGGCDKSQPSGNGAGAPSVVLTIQPTGNAVSAGTIRASGTLISCNPICQQVVAAGTTVTIEAGVVPRVGAWFKGWSGGCSGRQPICSVRVVADTTVIAEFEPANYMFVLDQPRALPLGDATADVQAVANALCTTAAAAAAPTPLGGSRWVAWLSTAGLSGGGAVDAVTKLGTAGGWMRPDGQPFANSADDIIHGGVLHPPRVTENGTDVGPDVLVATGTAAAGARADTCSDWTSTDAAATGTGGEAAGGPGAWTASRYRALPCGQAARFYCFGVDYDATVSSVGPVPVVGRAAFLSKGLFAPAATPAGGRAVADKICQDEADASQVVPHGTYLALLAADGQPASSRFDLTGAPWVRPDGVALAARAADLFGGTAAMDDLMLSTINVMADGTAAEGNVSVWTGAATPGAAGTAASTCGDWQSADVAGGIQGDAMMARAVAAPSYFSDGAAHACASGQPVYCLQQ